MTKKFSFKDKILILRLFRLQMIPSAVSSTELFFERAFPVQVVEFGNAVEKNKDTLMPFPKRRLQNKWARYFPRCIRPMCIFFGSFIQIFFHSLIARPQLIVAHGLQEQLMAWWLKLTLGVDYIVDVHEIYERHELTSWNRIYFIFEGVALRNALFLIFPGQTRQVIYQTRYRLRNHLFVVPNCTRLRIRKTQQGVSELKPPYMIYIGGISRLNAIEEMIEALVDIPNLLFLIAGWGEVQFIKSLKDQTVRLDLESRVQFLGVLKDEKWKYLENASLGYCVYKPELIRLKYAAYASCKLFEYIAAGVPVLTTQWGGFSEIVEANQIGVCIREISSHAIVKQVNVLLAKPLILHQMSERALQLHREVFNYERHFEPVLSELNRFIKQSPSAPPFQINAKAS